MKNIDHSPDITSDEYWDKHHIAVVRVTDLVPTEPNRPSIRHRVVTNISEVPIEPERTIPLRHWWLGPDPERASAVAPGDQFVVFYPREGRGTVAAVRIETSPEQSALVNRVRRIARLRQDEGGARALAEAVFDPDREVALYGLKRLLKQQARNVDQTFVARVRTLADAQDADPEIRLLAAQLLGKAALSGGSEQEYAWLESALSNAQGHDWTRLRALALRLLELPAKRAQVANLLTTIVKDPGKAPDVRIAAYSVFEDPRLFAPDGMDAVSDLVFDTVEWMAQSPDEYLRKAGAMLLHNLSRKVNPRQQSMYVERARTALESALAKEKGPSSVQLMRRSLDLLSPPKGDP